MKYKRLSIIEFGRQLLETNDLDPVYVALWNAKFTRIDRCRFILGWMMYYHCGLACWLMEQKSLLGGIKYVAEHDKEFPRGSQRKHHRKEPALKCYQGLRQFKTATGFIGWCAEAGPRARAVYNRVISLPGWGPCFGWRIADLIDREALGISRFCSDDTDLFFSSPRKGAILCANTYKLNMENPCLAAHDYVMGYLGHYKAPPRYERAINIQETETIFCKWKSHISGRYAIGRDTQRAREQLEAFKELTLCQRLLKAMPKN